MNKRGYIFIIALLITALGLLSKLLYTETLANVVLEHKVYTLKVDSVQTVWQHKEDLADKAKDIHELQIMCDYQKCVTISLTGKIKYWKNKAKACK